MNIILLALLFDPAPASFEAQTLDGRAVTGPLRELTADRLTIAAKKGDVSFDLQSVLTIAPTPRLTQAAHPFGVVVELTDGSIIRGRQYLAHGSQAQITLADGKVLDVPVGVVRTVQLRQAWAALAPTGRG